MLPIVVYPAGAGLIALAMIAALIYGALHPSPPPAAHALHHGVQECSPLPHPPRGAVPCWALHQPQF